MKEIIKQAMKFFGISGIGWILDLIIYTILTNLLNVHITIANIISSFVGVTFVFLTSTRKLFVNNSKINLKLKYVIYILYQIVLVLTISYVMSLIKTALINLNIEFIINNINLIVKIIVTPFTMCINFIVMKNLIEKI